MGVGDLATDIGLGLAQQGKAQGETYNVGGLEIVHRATMHALEDSVMFIGGPSYKDRFITLPSDMTIDEFSIQILNVSKYNTTVEPISAPSEPTPSLFGAYIKGSDEKAKIANVLIESEYKKGRYYPHTAQFISRSFAAPEGFRFLHIFIDGYIPKPQTGEFAFEEKTKQFKYEILDENFIPIATGEPRKGTVFDCIPPKQQGVRYKITFPQLSKPPVTDTPVLDAVMLILQKNNPEFLLLVEIAELE
jgi:hypothetical protein